MPRVILSMADADAVQARLLALVPGAEVVPHTDARRSIVLAAMAAQRAATGNGWDAAHAAQHVSVALPEILPAPLPDLLRMVPFAGGILGGLGAGFDHPTVFLAPSVENDPAVRIAVLCHEFGHLLQPGTGLGKVIEWCIQYGLHPEHRTLAAEGPCYSCDVAFRFWAGDEDPDAVADAVANGLRAYGANDALVKDVRRQLAGHVMSLRDGLCVPTRTVIEAVRVLRARGVQGLPALP